MPYETSVVCIKHAESKDTSNYHVGCAVMSDLTKLAECGDGAPQLAKLTTCRLWAKWHLHIVCNCTVACESVTKTGVIPKKCLSDQACVSIRPIHSVCEDQIVIVLPNSEVSHWHTTWQLVRSFHETESKADATSSSWITVPMYYKLEDIRQNAV
jgi:hypothetical protein